MTEGQMSIPEKETFGFFDKIGENSHFRTGTI